MKQEYLQSIQHVNQLDNKFLQDLVWLIYCQPITSISGLEYNFPLQENSSALSDWASGLDLEKTAEIKSYIPLGKYAEKLVKCYLENSTQINLLAANLQLIENEKITIGELDYLFEDTLLEEFIHLEFSIKYYLKTSIKNQVIYLGPSTKDYLARKIKKLLDHQTRLCKTHQHLLPIKLQTKVFQPKAIIKGCLFYPLREWLNRKMPNKTIEGWWLTVDELEQLNSTEDHFNLITQKGNWIFPFRDDHQLLSFQSLKRIVEPYLKESNEIMIVRYDANENPIDRGFLMRKKWPN